MKKKKTAAKPASAPAANQPDKVKVMTYADICKLKVGSPVPAYRGVLIEVRKYTIPSAGPAKSIQWICSTDANGKGLWTILENQPEVQSSSVGWEVELLSSRDGNNVWHGLVVETVEDKQQNATTVLHSYGDKSAVVVSRNKSYDHGKPNDDPEPVTTVAPRHEARESRDKEVRDKLMRVLNLESLCLDAAIMLFRQTEQKHSIALADDHLRQTSEHIWKEMCTPENLALMPIHPLEKPVAPEPVTMPQSQTAPQRVVAQQKPQDSGEVVGETLF